MRRSLFLLVSLLALNTAHANVVGSDSQSFNPTTSGLDFVTVHSSETLDCCILNVGVFTHYSRNTFPNFQDNNGGEIAHDDALWMGDLNFGYGLMKNWDIGLNMPFLFSYKDDATTDRIVLTNKGLTEFRLNTKYRFFGTKDYGVAAILSANFDQTENNPYNGAGADPTYNLEVAGDYTFGKIAAAINLGYRWRTPGSALPDYPQIEVLDDQFIWSLAANYLFSKIDTKLIAEIYGVRPVRSVNTNIDRQQTSAELLIGGKHDLKSNIALHGGFGTRLSNGIASPDWRVYVGVNWNFGPLCDDKPKPVQVAKAPPADPPIDDSEDFKDLDPNDPFANLPTTVDQRFIIPIHFKFDSDQLTGRARKEVENLVRFMRRGPGYTELVVEGHTDSVGGNAYNKDLSLRRARSVKKYLIKEFGVDGKKIKALGFGEERPIADNGNYQGRLKNRRVEFLVKRPKN